MPLPYWLISYQNLIHCIEPPISYKEYELDFILQAPDQTLDLRDYILWASGHTSFIYSRLNYPKVSRVHDQVLVGWHEVLV